MTKATDQPCAEKAREWVPVYDANNRLLFEVSLISNNVRIKKRELTTVVDVGDFARRERAKFFAFD